jgi:phasin family protein
MLVPLALALCGAAIERSSGAKLHPINGRHPITVLLDFRAGTSIRKGNAMSNVTEQFAELNQANVAQATKLSELALENADKLAKINMLTAKTALAQGAENAQAVAAVKDVQQLYALNTTMAQASVQGALNYSKQLYELATEAQAQYTALIEESWATYTKGAAAWVDQASKSAPAGSEAAVNAFKQGLAASTAAFDQFKQASKQVASLADASVRAAADNATKVAATATGRKQA